MTPYGMLPTVTSRLRYFAPIFPAQDMKRAVEHYESLGFTVDGYEDGSEYAFAKRDDVEIHLSATPDHDPLTGAACVYLYVEDAGALAEEWRRNGVGGKTGQAADTDYHVREGVHIDPDNNMIRFGSPIK